MTRNYITTAKSCRYFLPLLCIIDQRRILFWKKISCTENSMIRSVSVFSTCIGKTLSKYSLQSLYLNSSQIKYHIWKHVVDTSVFYPRDFRLSHCIAVIHFYSLYFSVTVLYYCVSVYALFFIYGCFGVINEP